MRSTRSGPAATLEGGLQAVAEGVWAWVRPRGGWGCSNAGLVVGEGASLVVDTPWDRRLARTMLDAMGGPTADAPVRLAVNTHADADHWWGNVELPDSAVVVTSRAAREAMAEGDPPKELARLARRSRRAARLPGRAGDPGRYVRDMLAPFEFSGLEPRLPDDAFEGRATEHVGGREVRLAMLGPAHTTGDVVVHVPDAGVVFAGDLVVTGVTPVMWAGPIAGWVAALDEILALDAATIVPGQGPVATPEAVRELRDYWLWLSGAVEAQRRMGHSATEAALEILRDPDHGRWRHWLLPERTVVTVNQALRQLDGKGRVVMTPAVRDALHAQIAVVRRELDGDD